MVNYDKVPVEYMRDGVRRYIERGVMPGDFLFALFSNDLKGAYRAADDRNTEAMRAWVGFVINEMPCTSQGSPAIVRAWCKAQTLRCAGLIRAEAGA